MIAICFYKEPRLDSNNHACKRPLKRHQVRWRFFSCLLVDVKALGVHPTASKPLLAMEYLECKQAHGAAFSENAKFGRLQDAVKM